MCLFLFGTEHIAVGLKSCQTKQNPSCPNEAYFLVREDRLLIR